MDFEARVVRLDPHTTKDDEGRAFPFTDALEQLLETAPSSRTNARGDTVASASAPAFTRLRSTSVIRPRLDCPFQRELIRSQHSIESC